MYFCPSKLNVLINPFADVKYWRHPCGAVIMINYGYDLVNLDLIT